MYSITAETLMELEKSLKNNSKELSVFMKTGKKPLKGNLVDFSNSRVYWLLGCGHQIDHRGCREKKWFK